MGNHLNPGNTLFQMSLNSKIYIDKTRLISYTNSVINTPQRFICVSRPRRFGKSVTAEMLAAYYGKNIDSSSQFHNLSIARDASYQKHLNQYNVIFLNIQKFLSQTHDISKMNTLIEKYLIRELLRDYPNIDYFDDTSLIGCLMDVFTAAKIPFVFIIDEWDCIFREYKTDTESQKLYLDFLRSVLKDQPYAALAYMTGILPIKKYGTHSALNMFDEFSMTNPGPLASFVGFTEDEVKALCITYNMDFEEVKRLYDGYCFEGTTHIYNPRSVVSAMLTRSYDNFWNKTETFEALRDYIVLNYRGLRDTVTELLAGTRKKINTTAFTNDMTTFSSADDVLTLLIHLGYLGYDFKKKEVFIPNSEIASEFCNAVESARWENVTDAIKKSDALLAATINRDVSAVAAGLEAAHMETSLLTYNDENALSCTIALAYYCAREYYMPFREFPSGKGFADIVYIPRKNHPDKPALVIELKWDKSAQGAIQQIKNRCYVESLKGYHGNLLLVGINYDQKTKKHQCLIEPYHK
ncbi:MAG: ATP-binding protein [Lachnospiraceae bacterium]|mgnify:CR=1 FL=1